MNIEGVPTEAGWLDQKARNANNERVRGTRTCCQSENSVIRDAPQIA